MTDDFTTALLAALADAPPVPFVEVTLPGHGAMIQMYEDGPGYAGGGCLLIPEGALPGT